MRRGFKTWCDKQSLYWRKELDLLPHQHLPSRSLADRFDVEVVYPEDIPGMAQKYIDHLLYHDPRSWSAVTVNVDGCSIIISNPQNSVVRQESDIMHEMAHIICNHDPIEFQTLPGSSYPFREYHKEDEEEAEWLGACLQIPREGLLWVMKRGIRSDEQIAEHFVASLEMVRFRRNKTGIDRQLQWARQKYPRK